MKSIPVKTVLSVILVLCCFALLAIVPLAVGAQEIQVPQDLADAPPVEELSPSMLVASSAEVDTATGIFGFLSSAPIWATVSLLILILGWAAFNLWMFIHALVKPIKKKVLWLLLLFFLGPIAAIVYFFTGRKSADEVYVVPTVAAGTFPAVGLSPMPPISSMPIPVSTPVPASPPPSGDPGVRLSSVIQGYAPEPAVSSAAVPAVPGVPTLPTPLPQAPEPVIPPSPGNNV